MNIKEIKKAKTEDLKKNLENFTKEFSQVKKEIRDGKEKNVRKGLRIKRIIARIQTVLNEREENND